MNCSDCGRKMQSRRYCDACCADGEQKILCSPCSYFILRGGERLRVCRDCSMDVTITIGGEHGTRNATSA